MNRTASWAFYTPPTIINPIGNEEFLNSYLSFGVWLRTVQAFECLNTFKHSTDNLKRQAALASFYSAVGTQLEDTTATLVAWMCWHRDENLRIADILYRLQFRRDKARTGTAQYAEMCIESLVAGKKGGVDPEVFVACLAETDMANVLKKLGIVWKHVPSVKVARTPAELEVWRSLPNCLAFVLKQCSAAARGNLAGVYNKIKHGPQIVVSDLLKHLRECDIPEVEIERIHAQISARGLYPGTLRILLEGSKTGPYIPGETPPNLFLDDDPVNAELLFTDFFFQMAMAMWKIGCHLQFAKFGKSWKAPPPMVVNEIQPLVFRTRSKRKLEQWYSQFGVAPSVKT